MTTTSRRLPLRVAAVLAASFIVACESSEVIAPDGSSITLSATPSQIVLSGGIQTAPVTVLATVFNQIGVPLPNQDVRFTTSSGVLDPPGGTPVRTDDFGNATTILTQATTGPQINARSGKVTATPITLNAATGILSSISLSVTPDQLIDSCSDTFTVTATATDPDGELIRGVTVVFGFGQTGDTFVIASFNPPQGITDISGKVTTTLDPSDTDCLTKCGGKSCDGIEIKAQDQSGTVISAVVLIQDTGSN